jgi:ATP-dependent Zn protease
MKATRTRRSTAYHEAAHGVAHHFFPLSGRTVSITTAPDKLSEYNKGKRAVNKAIGVHFNSATISSIIGRSIDREQVHHEIMTLLAGYAATWLYAGDTGIQRNPTKAQREEARRHASGRDDYTRAFQLLCAAGQFDPRDVTRRIPDDDRQRLSPKELMEKHGQPAIDAEMRRACDAMDRYRREALDFVASKWPHIQALGDALFKKKTLRAAEVAAIIEAVEKRIEEGPPDKWTAELQE